MLYQKGILICLCSKNYLDNIVCAFGTKGMILKKEHILICKTESFNKSESILEIANELNLSIDSFVFIDDSKYELGLINSFLPEIETIFVDPVDSAFIDTILASFDNTDSIINRTKLYKEQKEREKERNNFSNIHDYNASLETSIICGKAVATEVERLSELSKRTNQFNLSCKRYETTEMYEILSSPQYEVFSLHVTDKYGDMGIVGCAIVQVSSKIIIESMFISCRVLGREIENVFIDKLKDIFSKKQLYGIYVESEKNKRYLNFYSSNGVLLI